MWAKVVEFQLAALIPNIRRDFNVIANPGCSGFATISVTIEYTGGATTCCCRPIENVQPNTAAHQWWV
jgi:hypothetical protein